ncbi:MAG: acyl-CoA thioesterase [Bacteroidetes bacterium]|nr:acyl-CoA thioesterase [Bacteroidota bacterium]
MKSEFIHTIRVRYVECDSMGFVHHSVYATYFEEARTEVMRKMGLNYKEIEDAGIIMPVKFMDFHFKKAAFYDELLHVKVVIHPLTGVRCKFGYETRNSKGDLLNTGTTELFFASKKDMKPMKLPLEFENKIKSFIS